MQDIFEAIKSHIPIAQAFSTYGVAVNIHNKALCPFHKEKTPSLKIYPQTNSYYCFGCGAGGDAVKLVSHLFGLDPLAAAQKLNEDFNLGFSFGQPLTNSQKRAFSEKAQREAAAVSAFDSWCNNYKAYIERRLEVLKELLAIETALTQIDYDNGIYAMTSNYYTEFHLLEYEYGILNSNTNDEKVDLYICRTKGGEAV